MSPALPSILSFQHPLWQAGFRPFFPLAAGAGAVLPLAWISLLLGQWSWSGSVLGISGVHWHAHEMFFGFGGAVLVGFLLTASKNWVGIAGYRGRTLMLLSGLWLLERIAMLSGVAWPRWIFWPTILAFAGLAVVLLLHTLWVHRARDGFAAENRFFLLALPLLLPAKVLLLLPEGLSAGSGLALAVFRLAFLLMLERTIPAFLQSTLQLPVQRRPRLDFAVRVLALMLCAAPFLNPAWATLLDLALVGLLLWRFPGWQPRAALTRLEIGIMHVGYLAIVLQLLLAAGDGWGLPGSIGVHVFTLGAMGCVVPAMFLRIAAGHTGRRIVFDRLARTILWLAVAAALARTLGVALWPAGYFFWLWGGALAWCLLFCLWLWRTVPWVIAPRADGRAG